MASAKCSYAGQADCCKPDGMTYNGKTYIPQLPQSLGKWVVPGKMAELHGRDYNGST